jgi:hypothetical protein
MVGPVLCLLFSAAIWLSLSLRDREKELSAAWLQFSVQLPRQRINIASNMCNIIPWVFASQKMREMFLRYFIVLVSIFITSRILIGLHVHAVFFSSGLFMRFFFSLSLSLIFPMFIFASLQIQS